MRMIKLILTLQRIIQLTFITNPRSQMVQYLNANILESLLQNVAIQHFPDL